jgi:tRNA (adenine57-N1/adenine58-N1)-methyltransferase catalytic subunit
VSIAGEHPRGPLSVGERVLLIDRKDRRYLITLKPGASFQSHAGVLDHDAVIGSEEGVEVVTRRREGSPGSNSVFLVLRPTLADIVVKMPRGAQVIYPKDLGAILLAADVFPGARVLEAGVGSGALSLALLRAGCVVTGYELRADFALRAQANVAEHLGPDAAYRVEERDVYAGIDEHDLDRILLDLPEPWRVLEHAHKALAPGGILCAYMPTINQTAELRQALGAAGFGLAETFEVLRRTWHIEGRSVRPDHRMVAHTGFITTARRLVAPERARQVTVDVEDGVFDEELGAEDE